MAKFNEILVGRYNRFLQKLLQMKGGPPSPQLAGEIQPQFDVNDVPVELRSLLGWSPFIAGAIGAAIAAANSGVQLSNPLGSGVMIVLEQIFVDSSTNQNIDVSAAFNGPANLTNTFTGTRRDTRTKPQSVAVLSATAAVGTSDLPVGMINTPVIANNPVLPLFQLADHYIVMMPGHTVRCVGQTVNTITAAWFVWRERAFEETEATL